MNKNRTKPDYPTELETQLILRLPEEPSKQLRELLKTGKSIKNRLTIQLDNDMRHGEVKFDHWFMHGKIVELPTIIESMTTIDTKNFYKTADICQMLICKEEPDQVSTEDESSMKNKKKDLNKIDKKFLWPHGITPPTKNIRKRRFRKTLNKKCAEGPEIEKEVKRLLRADCEAEIITREVIKESDDQYAQLKPEPSTSQSSPGKADKKTKQESVSKQESTLKQQSSNVVDIFGGAVSDSDSEEDNIKVELDRSRISAFNSRRSNVGLGESSKQNLFPTDIDSELFQPQKVYPSHSHSVTPGMHGHKRGISSEDDYDYQSKDNMTPSIEQLRTEVEKMKLHQQQTQKEINKIKNLGLRQRFQEMLDKISHEIRDKEILYTGLLTLQNSKDN